MKKNSVVLAAATAATLATFSPCGWSQVNRASTLPPQLQTDAERKATRTARAVAAQGGDVQSAAAPEGSAAAALGTALLADVADAVAASAHDDATRSSRGPDPAPGRRGATGSRREQRSGDPPGPRQDGDPR